MKLIKQSFEILDFPQNLNLIEFAGRTCYKSTYRIEEDSAKGFVQKLMASGHESVLEHDKISVLLITNRAITHEIVRHRIASFSQESTRYCNYSKDRFGGLTFIIPEWSGLQEQEIDSKEVLKFVDTDSTCFTWMRSMAYAERAYLSLLSEGKTPQQARGVLPNDLKTEIVVTANIREWRLIMKQRTAKAAHPQMRELMIALLTEFKEKSILFDDIRA